MVTILTVSYLGDFGGISILKFPFDLLSLLPLSIFILYSSQKLLSPSRHEHITSMVEETAPTLEDKILT